MNEVTRYHANKHIALRQKTQHLRPKPPDLNGTEYTGLIKSTADLRYWANIEPHKIHCAKCEKSISRKLKTHNNGFCDDCAEFLVTGNRCCICFKKIHAVNKYDTAIGNHNLICNACNSKFGGNCGNSHGYKEGGKLSGGLRTNYRTDNVNDNNSRMLEDNT